MKSIGTIGFVGGGNMAEALIKGLLGNGVAKEDIYVSEPSEPRRIQLAGQFGIHCSAENCSVVESCTTLVLAVKPQIAGKVLDEMATSFDGEKRLISIAAGLATQTMEQHLTTSPRVVRAMPNTPALVGQGAAAICPGRFATEEDMSVARTLFEAVGSVVTVSEDQLDAVTGLSGSGPAYIYTVIEALADGGVQQGLTRDVALELATQTVLGAATLVSETAEHPALLRDKVCSPGGTTITGMRALEERGLRAALMSAVEAATARSRELGKH